MRREVHMAVSIDISEIAFESGNLVGSLRY